VVLSAEQRAPGRVDWLAFGGLLALAVLIRVLAWSRTAVLFNDGPIFLALAEALRAGRLADVLAHPQHPLYPALVAALELLSTAPESAAIAVSIAGGLLAVGAVFWMAWARFGREVAWISAWVVALHPWAVDFSSDVMSDGLYAGLYLAGFAVLVDWLERPYGVRALAFGALAGLAYLTRPEGLVLVVVAVVCMAWRAASTPDERGRLVRGAGVALVACAALAGGLRFAEARIGEDLAVTQKKSIAQLARGGPSAAELARDRLERREAREDPNALPLPEGSIRADRPGIDRPEQSLAGLLEAIARVVRTSLSAFRYELIAFAVVGVLAAARRVPRERRAFEGVLAVSLAIQTGLLVLLVWGAGYVSRRHALAAWLPLGVYAAVGWTVLIEKASAWLEAPARSGGFAAGLGQQLRRRGSRVVLVVVLMLSWGPRDLRERRADRALERVAAEWLKENQAAVGPVASQKRRTAYYAGAPFVPIPDGRDGQIERQLRGRGTRWLVIDAAKLGDHRGLAEGIGRWLDPVHSERLGAQEILVLEVTRPPAP
jgi:hypothetical protein